MNRLTKGVPILLLWSSVGCRFDFEILQPTEENPADFSANVPSFAGASSSSGGDRSDVPPSEDGGNPNVNNPNIDDPSLGGAPPSGGAGSGGADSGGAGSGGAGSGGADSGGADSGGADSGGADSGGADSGGRAAGGADPDPSPTGGQGGMPTCTPLSGCTCATLDEKTYQFCSNDTDFAGAVFQCGVGLFGLLELETAEENDFVQNQATAAGLFDGSTTPYTSGSDLFGEGSWTWQSLTVFWSGDAAQVPFTNWNAPPSNDTSSNCLLVDSDGTWIEGGCDTARPFICESP